MISAGRKFPLISSTSTVSSFSFTSSRSFTSSSSSSLTTTATTNTTDNKRSNSVSFPIFVLPLSSPSLSLLIVIFSLLLCQYRILGAPSSPPHKWPTAKYNLEKQFLKKNFTKMFTNYKGDLHEEMTQNDQPPRDLSDSVGVPKEWGHQPQNRMFYLRTEGDQYMQLHKGQITGTKEVNPPFGKYCQRW